MALWIPWCNAIWQLRPAFSRLRTFLWFATAVAGFTVRTELLGATSLVRALNLNARFYNKLVDHFHSPAVKLDRLAALWTQTVLRLFPQPLRINGRCVVVGDGIKVPKRGRKMPGVKLLHQQSESNTKPEYIMGHSLQAVSLLVHAAKLRSLLDDPKGLEQAKSPVYGERQVVIHYKVRDLLWRPAGRLVRFVAVIHPTRGSCLLMCTDTSLAAIEIIRLYGLRFKIEHTFKQAVRLIGSFSYHFWMSDMKPVRRRSGNQHVHRASSEYRDLVRRKLHAYHVFIQAAVVCQGLLQYLAVAFPQRVWDAFGSWLRTIRPGIPPSELVVANALRHSMPEFLLNSAPDNVFAKFVIERQDTDKMQAFSLAA